MVALTLALTLLGWGTPTARAADPDAVRVVIAEAVLSGSAPTDTLTISGTITNLTGPPLLRSSVTLWRSPTPLRTPSALAAALADDQPPTGAARVVRPSHQLSLTLPETGLAAGASASFSVRGTLADLRLTTAGAAYVVGVAWTHESAAAITRGVTPTLISLGTEPVGVATVVELSATPRLVKNNLFVDDGLADDLSGRLRTLLDAAAQPGASYLLDPALLDEVADLADGYRVVDGSTTRAGTGAEVAARWLRDLAALPPEREYRTWFARPDVTALVAAQDPALLARVKAASFPGGARPERPTLLTLESLDAITLAQLRPPGDPVLLESAALPVVSVSDGFRIVAATRPDALATPAWLERTPETARAVLEAQARVAGGQVRLIRSASDLTADRASAPAWVSRRPLADLLARAPEPLTEPPATPDTPAVLDAAGARRVSALVDDLSAYGSAAPGSGVSDLVDAHVARAASRSWLGDAAAQQRWWDAVDARAGRATLEQAVILTASPRFTMASSESDFPVTVTNTLPDDITVAVVAGTDNPARVRLSGPSTVTVRAGSSQLVSLHASSSGNGVVAARVRIDAPNGRRLTPDVGVVLEATDLGVIGWVIVVGSGLVTVVTTALRIRQVRRRKAGGVGG